MSEFVGVRSFEETRCGSSSCSLDIISSNAVLGSYGHDGEAGGSGVTQLCEQQQLSV